jgi:hypothetical protein
MWTTPTPAFAARLTARAVRLARYRRWLAAVGLGVVALSWVAAADALVCTYIVQGGRAIRVCR